MDDESAGRAGVPAATTGRAILTAWRDAERRLRTAAPDAAQALSVEVVRLRAAYHEWMEEAMAIDTREGRAPSHEPWSIDSSDGARPDQVRAG